MIRRRVLRGTLLGAAVMLVVAAAGCGRLAVWSAPAKTPTTERTAAAVEADKLFWKTLHAGEYARIPDALTALKAAYLENPRDAVTAAHVGWLHIWRLGERARQTALRPDITDDAVLGRKYFEEAVRLDPGEARYLGFYAGLLMAEGTIHKDEKMVRRGFYAMKDAVRAWPEFNYFTAGYTASGQPVESARFREALEQQWLNLDVCTGQKVDRANPDYARYMPLETKEGPRRVCWNSWIAPHNFEGFFLNFGDMLVKAGQPDLAVPMYRNAKHAREYATGPTRPCWRPASATPRRTWRRFAGPSPRRTRPRSWCARPSPAWAATRSDPGIKRGPPAGLVAARRAAATNW